MAEIEAAFYVKQYFDVHPSMQEVYKRAVAEQYTPERLQQEVRATEWYRTTPQSEREAWLQRVQDPAEFQRRKSQLAAHVSALATQIGFTLPQGALSNIVNNALAQGWDDTQIRRYMGNWSSAFKQARSKGTLGGMLAQAQNNIVAAARANGVRLPGDWITTWLHHIMTGQATEEQVIQKIRQKAASAFPGLAEEIAAGQNVMDIAREYIDTMARLWEVNSKDIDLYNPTLRQALSHKGQDGKLGLMSIYDFEKMLKRDPRWFKTDNAQETIMPMVHQVLSDFGFMS